METIFYCSLYTAFRSDPKVIRRYLRKPTVFYPTLSVDSGSFQTRSFCNAREPTTGTAAIVGHSFRFYGFRESNHRTRARAERSGRNLITTIPPYYYCNHCHVTVLYRPLPATFHAHPAARYAIGRREFWDFSVPPVRRRYTRTRVPPTAVLRAERDSGNRPRQQVRGGLAGKPKPRPFRVTCRQPVYRDHPNFAFICARSYRVPSAPITEKSAEFRHTRRPLLPSLLWCRRS